VAASHLHPDHYDVRAVRALAEGSSLMIMGPQGIRKKSRTIPHSGVYEMAPGESLVKDEIRITATEALHSGPEINFLFKGKGETVFFGGDCRFSNSFDSIASRHPVDIAILPIGGTRVLGRQIVMGPNEALEAVRILRPGIVIPIHEGGIWMSVPPLSLHPGRPEHLAKLVREDGLKSKVVILKGGETFSSSP